MKNNFEGGFILNGHVRSYTPKVSEESKMSKQGEQQSLHSLLPLGEGAPRPDEGADVSRSYTLVTAKEVRPTIIHDETRHEAVEPASCKSLEPCLGFACHIVRE